MVPVMPSSSLPFPSLRFKAGIQPKISVALVGDYIEGLTQSIDLAEVEYRQMLPKARSDWES